MTISREILRQRCLAQPEAAEYFPFGEDPAVFHVLGKMFAYLPLDEDVVRITLKCDPTESLVLQAQYEAIAPGYHMNKRHWISIHIDGTVPEDELFELIDGSYALVVKKLPRAERDRLRK